MTAAKSLRRPPPAPRGQAPRRTRARRRAAAAEARSAAAGWRETPFAVAATAFAMAAVTLGAALAGESVIASEAGRFWAFAFAGALAAAGLFLALIGFALREERRDARLPVASGLVAGALTALLLLDGAAREAVIAPLALLLLALPPVRGALARLARRARGGRP